MFDSEGNRILTLKELKNKKNTHLKIFTSLISREICSKYRIKKYGVLVDENDPRSKSIIEKLGYNFNDVNLGIKTVDTKYLDITSDVHNIIENTRVKDIPIYESDPHKWHFGIRSELKITSSVEITVDVNDPIKQDNHDGTYTSIDKKVKKRYVLHYPESNNVDPLHVNGSPGITTFDGDTITYNLVDPNDKFPTLNKNGSHEGFTLDNKIKYSTNIVDNKTTELIERQENNLFGIFHRFPDFSNSLELEVCSSEYQRYITEISEHYEDNKYPFSAFIISDTSYDDIGIKKTSLDTAINKILISLEDLDITEITIDNHDIGSINGLFNDYNIHPNTISKILNKYKNVNFNNIDLDIHLPAGKFTLNNLSLSNCNLYSKNSYMELNELKLYNVNLYSDSNDNVFSHFTATVKGNIELTSIAWKGPLFISLTRKSINLKEFKDSKLSVLDMKFDFESNKKNKQDHLFTLTGFNNISFTDVTNYINNNNLKLINIINSNEVLLLGYNKKTKLINISDITFNNCFKISLINCNIYSSSNSNIPIFKIINPPGIQNKLTLSNSIFDKVIPLTILNGKLIDVVIESCTFNKCNRLFLYKGNNDIIDSLSIDTTFINNCKVLDFNTSKLSILGKSKLVSPNDVTINTTNKLVLDDMELISKFKKISLSISKFNGIISLSNVSIQSKYLNIESNHKETGNIIKTKCDIYNSSFDINSYINMIGFDKLAFNKFHLCAPSIYIKDIYKLSITDGHFLFNDNFKLFSIINTTISQFDTKIEQRKVGPCNIRLENTNGKLLLNHMTLKSPNMMGKLYIEYILSPVFIEVRNKTSKTEIEVFIQDSNTGAIGFSNSNEDITIRFDNKSKDLYMPIKFSRIDKFRRRDVGKKDKDVFYYGVIPKKCVIANIIFIYYIII